LNIPNGWTLIQFLAILGISLNKSKVNLEKKMAKRSYSSTTSTTSIKSEVVEETKVEAPKVEAPAVEEAPKVRPGSFSDLISQ